jgi:hypothetical protein
MSRFPPECASDPSTTITLVDGDSSLDLDMAVAALGADGADVQLMMRFLIEKLADVLGDRLRVDRGGGLRRRSTGINRVQVRIGNSDLEARLNGATAEFSIGQLSGGIRIRSERTDAANWIRALLQSLQAEASHSASARQALEAIVIGQP